jgi:hypothetical protein
LASQVLVSRQYGPTTFSICQSKIRSSSAEVAQHGNTLSPPPPGSLDSRSL